MFIPWRLVHPLKQETRNVRENRKLGRLEKVALRDLWGGDTSEFVEWLRLDDNLSLLGGALGRPLVVVEDSPSDIAKLTHLYCRDTESGVPVIVRVNFDTTTDEQLGQLLSAAANQSDAVLVWVASEMNERHQSVMNWLNKVTSEKIQVYGLEVAFWQIGNSPLAPTVTVVCRPQTKNIPSGQRRVVPAFNAATAAAASGTPLAKPSPLFLEYWLAFNGNLIHRKSSVVGQKPTAANWMSFPFGSPQFSLVATVNPRDHFVAVALVLTGPEAKSHFQLLQHSKVAIENEIGATLEWQELPDKPESRVLLRRFGMDPDHRAQWQEQHDWLADKLERFQRAFALRVEALTADEDVRHEIADAPMGGLSAAQ